MWKIFAGVCLLYFILLSIFYFCSKKKKESTINKLYSKIKEFDDTNKKSLIEKIKYLKTSGVNDLKNGMLRIYSFIAIFIFSILIVFLSFFVDDSNKEIKLILDILPLVIIFVVEVINLIFENYRDKIEGVIQKEIIEDEIKLYCLLANDKENLAITLPSNDKD